MMLPKHNYTLVEILKNDRIGQSMTFNGNQTPEEVKKNIEHFKFQLDNTNKICVIAVVPSDRLTLPQNASELAHEICVYNLIKKEEIYYLGYPLNKNNEETNDTTSVAGVRIGRYIQADFKPGDYIIHPLNGKIFRHFGTASKLCNHKIGGRMLHTQQGRGKNLSRDEK